MGIKVPLLALKDEDLESFKDRLSRCETLGRLNVTILDDLADLADQKLKDNIDACLKWGSALETNSILEQKWSLFKTTLLRLKDSEANEDEFEDHDQKTRYNPRFLYEIACKLIRLNPELLAFSAQGKARCTVMHEAARSASPDLFEELVTHCVKIQDHFPGAFQSFTRRDQDSATPLHHLFLRDDQRGLLGMVSLVLKKANVTELDADTLRYFIGKKKIENKVEIFKLFIDSEKMSSEVVHDMIGRMIDGDQYSSPESLNIFLGILIARFRRSNTVIGVDVIVKLIERINKEEESELIPAFHQAILATDCQSLRDHELLHKALTGYVKADVVEALLERCPELVLESDEHNLMPMARVNAQELEMRTLIAARILRLQEETLKSQHGKSPQSVLRTIRHLLEGREMASGASKSSKGLPSLIRREITLDLANFPDSSPAFFAMVKQSLPAEERPMLSSKLCMEFETVLRYVNIPVPDLLPSGVKQRAEILNVVRWLREVKEVTGIYELRIHDSSVTPHSEEIMRDCLQDNGVEMLDWKRLDMSVEPLLARTIPQTLREVTIYASAWTTLYYWTSTDTRVMLIKTFEKLRKVKIFICEPFIGPNLVEEYQRMAEERISSLEVTGELAHFEFEQEKKWPIVPATRQDLMNGSDTYKKRIGVVEHMKLEYFVQAYSRLQFQFHSADWRDENLWHTQLDHDSRITVALIDTGVNPGLSAAFDPMSTSFVHTAGGESPWFCSHHPHGTQMARIISQLDPSCKVLVIKVSETGRDISAERLTEAIDFARKARVDIISFSATLSKNAFGEDARESGPSESYLNLKDALKRAQMDQIAIFASAEGEGHTHNEVFPAHPDFKMVSSIAASTQYGKEAPGSIKERASFLLPGTNNFLGDNVVGLESADEPDFSTSVATAVAAGVASLILACHRLSIYHAQPWSEQLGQRRADYDACMQEQWDTAWKSYYADRADNVQKVLDTMAVAKAKNVRPEHFFQDDGKGDNWAMADTMLDWLHGVYKNNHLLR